MEGPKRPRQVINLNNQDNTIEFEPIKAVQINIGRIDKIINLNDAHSFEGANSRHAVHNSAYPHTNCKIHKLPRRPRFFNPPKKYTSSNKIPLLENENKNKYKNPQIQ